MTVATTRIVSMPAAPRPLAAGLHAARGVLTADRVAGPHAHEFHMLTVFLSPPGRAEWRDGADPERVSRPTAGDAVLWPADRVVDARIGRTCECVSVLLAPRFVERAATAGGLDATFRPSVLRRDEFVTQTALALAREAAGTVPGRGVLAEAVGTALAVHLLRAASANTPRPEVPAPGRIDPAALDAVVRYINAHIGEELSVARLADVAGVSRWHFSRLFRTATGLPPHQFVVRRRVERARELLDTTGRKLAAVAAEVGFASQGHLSAHFRRHYGVSPGEYAGRRITRRPQ